MQYDQQTADWTSKLVEYQLEAAEMLEDGKVRNQLLRAYRKLRNKSLEARPILPIDVMNRIEKFVVKGDLKMPSSHFLVRTGNVLPPITALVNRQFKLVTTLNPVSMGPIAMYFETYEFFWNPNRELNKARTMVGYFAAVAAIGQMPSSPQPLYAPREP